MDSKAESEKNLKKVIVSFTAGAEGESLTPRERTIEFIFGVGSQGFLPFECDLSDKAVGGEFEKTLDAAGAAEYFGHVFAPVDDLFDRVKTLDFRFRFKGAEDVPHREVVRAMAQSTGECGCGCGCGCG